MAPMLGRRDVIEGNKCLLDGFVRQNYMDNAAGIPVYQDVMNMIYDAYGISVKDVSVQDLMDQVLDPKYFSIECKDFDPDEDLYIHMGLIYRGDISRREAELSRQLSIIQNQKASFVDWVPETYRMHLYPEIAPQMDNDDIFCGTQNIVMLGNNVCFGRFFHSRVSRICGIMHDQGAFTHWFYGEGPSYGEMCEPLRDLNWLEKDYMDVLAEDATDELTDE